MRLIDLHLHLLPGIDDGPRTMAEAVEMARALVAVGFAAATPSPHHRVQFPSSSVELCRATLEAVQAELARLGVPLGLALSAENHFLEDGLMAELATPRARVIARSRAVLVEAPYSGPLPALPELVFRMRLKGLTPVIAHPERCLEFERPGRAAEVVRGGALLQLDLGSLIGRYGKGAQIMALGFLERGLYSVAGTDAHSPVGLQKWVGSALTALERAGGREAVAELLERGPRAILGGDAFEGYNPSPKC